jgi:acylphosphatase
MHHLLVRVRGRVQGVGFRGWVVERAWALALNGRVRNLPDGSVEIDAEGEDRGSLERLLADVREGPPAARVTEVDVVRSEGPARYRTFETDWVS